MVPIEPEAPAPGVLVDQPTAMPTRKWGFDAIASAGTLILSLAVIIFGDIGVSEDDVNTVVGAVASIAIVVGKIVGYFTRNREGT